MAARTGAEYIKGLQAQECDVWLHGEGVKDVTTHPDLANGVRAIQWDAVPAHVRPRKRHGFSVQCAVTPGVVSRIPAR